ncbi:hypothetical protein QQ020_30740 [Fulvivirgaceae bacterium BMA12]|uniref:Lipoprotein n=1 Tax=Agaribacillus aureus TaxID=3051825 RepID=A0ABT8LJB6_9BACT|nr:hypothetical protein [Fulvivirgaceae bacterium BMA12]
MKKKFKVYFHHCQSVMEYSRTLIMRRFSYLFLFAIVSACGGSDSMEPSITVNPQSLNPTVTLSTSSESAEINPANGGTIILTDTKGNTYRLDIPRYAIVGSDNVTITLTAQETVDNLPERVSFVVGLNLEPASLEFVIPVSLSITIAGTVTDEIIGFHKFQNEQYFIPTTTSSNSQGFASLYGFGEFSVLAIPPALACTESNAQSLHRFIQDLACIQAFYGEDFIEEDETLQNISSNLLDFTISSLQSANDVKTIIKATRNYNAWYLGADATLFSSRLSTVHDLMTTKVGLARDMLNQECVDLTGAGQNTDDVNYDFQQLGSVAGRTRSERFDVFAEVDLDFNNFCQ